jgi:Ca2+/Na+ antiporter
MDFLYSFLVVGHFIGLAAIIGPFVLQMRSNSGFAIGAVLGGAITQLVTGIALTGIAASQIEDYTKIFVKLAIALIVFVAALIGWLRSRKNGNTRKIKPFFHAAGGLAIVNVILAVFW